MLMSISNVKIYCFYLASPFPARPGPHWTIDMSLPGLGGTFEYLSKLRIDVIIVCVCQMKIINNKFCLILGERVRPGRSEMRRRTRFW